MFEFFYLSNLYVSLVYQNFSVSLQTFESSVFEIIDNFEETDIIGNSHFLFVKFLVYRNIEMRNFTNKDLYRHIGIYLRVYEILENDRRFNLSNVYNFLNYLQISKSYFSTFSDIRNFPRKTLFSVVK